MAAVLNILHLGADLPSVAGTFGTRCLRAGLHLIFCGGLIGNAPAAQTAAIPLDLTLRSDVTEVRMTFSTTDKNDHIVATIQPADFAIVDQDRVVRDFRSFSRSEYSRIDVVALVDTSGSMAPQFPQELSHVIQLIAGAQSVPEECFSVLSFRDLKPAVVCEGNCHALKTQAQFPVVQSGGTTPLYDSIVFASHMLARRGDLHTRRILVLFSDGADTISLKSFSDAVDAALDNDVAIYSVDVGSQPRISPGTAVLRRFAGNTGGRYFPLEAGTGKVLNAILDDFRATYTVAYKLPSHAPGFHEVRIFPTHNLGLQFHCRHGYYYPSQHGK